MIKIKYFGFQGNYLWEGQSELIFPSFPGRAGFLGRPVFHGKANLNKSENWEGHGLPGLLLEPPLEIISSNLGNSTALTHFSFTNALGLMSAEQTRAMHIAIRRFPKAQWVVALHHHLVERVSPCLFQ